MKDGVGEGRVQPHPRGSVIGYEPPVRTEPPGMTLKKTKRKNGQFSQKELRVKAKEVEFKKEIQSEAKKLSYGDVDRNEARSTW